MSRLQFGILNLFYQNDTDTLESTNQLCEILDYSNLNIIMHPFSALLILIYMFLFWRRSCCLKCLFARPAPPMIIHPFKKNDRFYTAAVYGIIAYRVMDIVSDAIFQSSASDYYSKLVNDPSGLFKLTLRIIEVFLSAIRYYPELIAFCADSFFIYLTASVHLLIDLGNNIFIEGSCNGFSNNFNSDALEIEIFGNAKAIFNIVKDVPLFLLESWIVVILFYRSILKLIQKSEQKLLINEDLKFYSVYDLKYCINLFKRKKRANKRRV